jgi:adenylate kinase family enzyme
MSAMLEAMKTCRVHVMGASGAGVTTLGRALADALGLSHHDVDDYYWRPTNPPYRDKREVADRLRLMRDIFLDRDGWVLSGSLDGWGAPVVPFFDLVIFVLARTEVRLQRLRHREARRFGAGAISPGGWRHQETEEFIAWASHYEDGSREGRNLTRHQAWLTTLTCPAMRLDGTRPTPDLVSDVIAVLDS